ncbi:MAG: V-type ATP synthase subunit I [Clostridiales bacterium]|nr:V-type ATP synthase subunit I [Clostridiales bacterium]
MAVLQMQSISICALKKDRKRILEFLQRRGVVEISDKMSEDSVFQKMDVDVAESILNKNIESAKEAIRILDKYVPAPKSMLSMLEGREEIKVEQYDEFYDEHDSILRIAGRIEDLQKKIAEGKAEVLKLEAQIEILAPWHNLDVSFNQTGTKHTSVFTGILPSNWTLERIYEVLSEDLPVDVEIISEYKEQTCIFVLCLKDKQESVLESLRGVGFSQKISMSRKAPKVKEKTLQEESRKIEADINVAEEEIKSYSIIREKLEFLTDYDTMRQDKYQVIGRLLQSKKVLVLTGFIPEREVEETKRILEGKFDVVVECEDASEADAPILLENNGLSNSLESVVEGYSLPGEGEADPTFSVSIFYYLLFGLMLSDAGYGLLMVGVCGFAIYKFKNMEESMKRTLKMYFFCGLGTIFWGIMFGGYFGDALDVISENFFGKKITIPAVWFYPVNEPMRMLVFSLLVGIIHLYSGLFMKAIQYVKQRKYKDILYDVIFWYGLLTSCVVIVLSMDMFKNMFSLSFIIPPTVVTIAGVVVALSSIGIVSTSGRESRNPFKRFLKGLYGFYGITGYLSDVLSYSRLLALGLATGVICTVVNKMAAMGGNGIFGAILFIIVFIAGHLMNFAINALGAYVHTNRLQYVEFFGKFYEGGGRKFSPFRVKTKYYKFKENKNNG